MWKQLSLSMCLIISACALFAQGVATGDQPTWLFRLKPDLGKVPAAREISNGYYLELIDLQTNVPAQAEYTHFIRHIVNETGVQNASEVSVEFAPDYQHVIFHQISVIREGKIVSTLKASQIKVVQEETSSGDFQYNGIKRAFVVLKDVRSNDRIDVAYTVAGFNPVYKGHFTNEFYFYSGVSVSNYFQTIITTKAHPLNFKYFNEAPSPRRFHHDDTLMYFWQDPPLKAPETSNTAPTWYSRYNSVSVTEYKSWKEVADWGMDLFQHYQVPLSPLVKNKVADLMKKAGGDKTQFASLATRFVQDEIRYLGMEIGIYTHKPHDPGQVYSQRYGDCKDKAFLLAMMLREAGINAYVALLSTTLTTGLVKEDPAPHKFNHVIVAIDNGKGYQFIDATISSQRGAFNDIFVPAYGYALVLRSETTALDEVTPGKIKKSDVRERLFVKYKEAGPSMLEADTYYDGGSADFNRNTFTGSSLTNLQDNFLRYYNRYYDSVEVEKELVVTDDPVKNQLQVSESYRLPALWKTRENGKEYFSSISHGLLEFFPNPGNSYKKGPLSLPFPLDAHYSLELHLPEIWGFPNDEYHINNDYYRFSFTIKQKDSVVTLDYRLVTLKDNIPEERVNGYLQDFKHILDRFEYTLTRGETTTGYSAPTAAPVAQGINVTGLMVCLITLAVLFLLFRYCNKLSVETIYIPGTGLPLGGWLIVLGLGLLAAIIIQAIPLFSFNLFSLSQWQTIKQLGGSNLGVLILIEETMYIILIGAYAANVYWFIKRRDIFPRAFITTIILKLCLIVLLGFCYTVIPYPANLGDFAKDIPGQFGRTAVYAAIWITYLLRSERVKTTFIEPYNAERENSNRQESADQENIETKSETDALLNADTGIQL